MLLKLEKFFAKMPPAAVYSYALASLALIWALDRGTRGELGVIPFYWIPVLIATLGGSLAGGLVVSAVAALTWLAANYDAGSGGGTNLFWNVYGRFLFFSTISVVVQTARTARLQNDMVAMVNHEFSNALGSMHLMVGMLRDGEMPPLPDARTKGYELLDKNIRFLGSVTQRFLDLHRIQTRFVGVEVALPLLRAILDEAILLLRLSIEHKHLKVSLSLPETPVSVRADPGALALILSNLISNAVKYTPAGGSVTLKVSREPNSNVAFSVEDSGIGIAEKDLDLIFSPYYRAHEVRAAATGHGLGLKIASDLLERHGSRLKVASVPGKGSRFHFTLPAFS